MSSTLDTAPALSELVVAELSDAIRRALRDLGLGEPGALAEKLEVSPETAAAILRRRLWDFDLATFIAQRAGIRIAFSAAYEPEAQSA